MLLNCGVREDSLESLGLQEIQPVHPKGDQSWVSIGRTDVEVETPILWPLDAESWLIWKDPDAGKDWGQEEKGTTEDEMVGWHHWHNGHGFGWTPGVGDGQGGLACFGSWGPEELDTTEQLNWLRDYHTKWINQTEKDKLSLVCEIKIKKDPIELMKTQTDWETWKTNTEVTKVQGGRDKSGFGINTDTLLGIKQIPNKDLLHSTVNYTS